jgi:prepilin-type N-terminal cleavage/methylation domain-containing protein
LLNTKKPPVYTGGFLFAILYIMQWAQKQKGFTIVELLIVIVVIAILASIVLVGYGGIVDRARALGLQNSLRNASTLMEIDSNGSGSYTSVLPADTKADDDIVLQLAGGIEVDGKGYCINGYRISKYEVASYDSKNGEVVPYLCPGILKGSPVGGVIPQVPLNVNLSTEIAQWKLSGGTSYNTSSKEITFSGASGSATSPMIYVSGNTTSVALKYELFSTTSVAPNVSHYPNAATYSGSNYYSSDGTTAVNNTSGYTGNGNSQSVPLNTWTSRTWTVPTGPNVHYIRFNITLSPTWTSNNFVVRNISVYKAS